MSLSWGQIVSKIEQRRLDDGYFLRNMLDVRDAYNGDVVVPLVDVVQEPTMGQLVPALVSDAIDQTAMRAASTRPTIIVPQLRPGPTAEKRANTARRAYYAAWHRSGLGDVLLRRAFRHWTAYGTTAMVVMPDHDLGRSRVELRDPLGIYPDYRHPDDIENPRDVGSIYGRSAQWILAHYGTKHPDLHNRLKGASAGDVFDVVEWIDAEDMVVGVMGPRHRTNYYQTLPQWPAGGAELSRWPNRAGMVPMAIPHRVTLDRVTGQVSQIVGMVNLMARMTALDVVAADKAVFPDLVVIGENNMEPRLIGGRWHDGREGEPNLLANVRSVQNLQSAPGPLTHPVLDRLERAARITSGNPTLQGGETGGALRSGQTVSALGAQGIDPRVQEAQEVMARALESVNKAIRAVEQGYFGTRKIIAFSGWASDTGTVEYTPNDVFDTDDNMVRYALPGADANHISIAVSQLVGSALMSRHTGRTIHPYIDDPDLEEHHIVAERLDDAIVQGFVQQASTGALPLADLARVAEIYDIGHDLPKAIAKAHQEAQERQAALPPPPEPGQAVPPSTQPGLALPGQGIEAQAPEPAIPPAPPSLDNLKGLLGALRAKAGTQGEPAGQGPGR